MDGLPVGSVPVQRTRSEQTGGPSAGRTEDISGDGRFSGLHMGADRRLASAAQGHRREVQSGPDPGIRPEAPVLQHVSG